VARVYAAVEIGRLSLGKAARLLDLTVQQFDALCRGYGLPLSYEV
jgi:predicted HTH domain antitoxin